MPGNVSERATTLIAASLFGTAAAISPFARGFFGNDQIAATAVIALLAMPFIAGLLARPRDRVRLELSPLLIAILAFIAWTIVCAWLSRARGASADAALQIGLLALAELALLVAPKRESALRGVLAAVILIGVVWAAIGDYQLLVRLEPPMAYFLNQNSYAGFLNLAFLGAAGALLSLGSTSSRGLRAPLLVSLVVLGLSIGASSSRGALLGDMAGIVVLTSGAWRAGRLRQGVILAAGLFALVVLGGELPKLPVVPSAAAGPAAERIDHRQPPLIQRLAESTPANALAGRTVIWERALAMVEDAPWHGVGPGLFWLTFPRYRSPADASAGFHVHNDYLEFAAELGVPGAILFLAILLGATAAWWRATAGDPGDAMLASGLGAGLAAMFAHGAVDFDFFILPTIITAGAFMAGLHMLGHRARPYREVTLLANTARGSLGARLLLAAAPVLVVAHSATAALAAYHYESALALGRAGRPQDAAAELERSLAVRSRFEAVHLAYADLDLHALRADSAASHQGRITLATHALAQLAKAEELNPLRSDVLYLTGLVHLQTVNEVGERAIANARSSFELALRRDPRNVDARFALVQLLGATGDATGAFNVSEAGVNLYYDLSDQYIRYMALAAELRIRNGDAAGAETLALRADRDLTSRRRPAIVLDAMRSAHPELAESRDE